MPLDAPPLLDMPCETSVVGWCCVQTPSYISKHRPRSVHTCAFYLPKASLIREVGSGRDLVPLDAPPLLDMPCETSVVGWCCVQTPSYISKHRLRSVHSCARLKSSGLKDLANPNPKKLGSAMTRNGPCEWHQTSKEEVVAHGAKFILVEAILMRRRK